MPRKRQPYKYDTVKHMFSRFIVGEEKDGTELRAFCPLCEVPGESDSPSATFNPGKDLWACKSAKCPSGGGGRITSLVDDLKKNRGFNPNREMMKGRNADPAAVKANEYTQGKKKRIISDDEVASWARRLHNSPRALAQLLEERGFTNETLRKWKIGWDGQRYMIPVLDDDGSIVNVRRYKLKAGPKNDKMLNIPGCGEARIFGLSILKANDTIVITEGETDCILANQHGIPAVTHTAGAATFKTQWGPLFYGKNVYIAYDNDEGGKSGAIKVAKAVSPFAEQVFILEIPIPVKGADVTDFLFKEGHTAEDFKELMAQAKPAKAGRYVTSEAAPTEGKKVSLEESMSQENSQETLELTVTVAGKQNPPYDVPKRFTVNCSTDKGVVCQTCPVFLRDGQLIKEFQPNDKDLFRFIDVNEDKHKKLLREISGARCTDRSEFTVDETYTMEELTVGNSVDDRSSEESLRPITRHVFSVSTHATEVNSTVRLVGQNTNNPKNQRKSFMAWKNDPVRTSLDSFVLDSETRDTLNGFRWEPGGLNDKSTPLDKCFEIAKDLSRSVTHIYGRELLHVAYDLVWHSPLSFEVDGELIEKGWLEAMVIGDTRTGKSETAIKLARHYRSGVVKSCEGATFAGLVGGVQQFGTSWMTTWGVIPLNDRRLVVLDEVSGLKDKDVIENMSSIRSSGLAQIVKISNEQTSARTRLIWISNPGDGSMLDDKPDVGMAALRTVVESNEDIARFDMVLGARAGEVSSSLINDHHKQYEPFYDQEMCAALVLWTWSLQPHQIRFTKRAAKAGRDLAQEIGEQYVPDPPLLQVENCRFKLYRIAAAIAARTFSVEWPEKGVPRLMVAEEHVRDAKRFLDMIYEHESMQYRTKSKKIIMDRERAAKLRHQCKMYLIEHSDTVLQALRFVGGSTTFKVRDFKEFGGMNDAMAQQAVKDLQMMRMVTSKGRGDMSMEKTLVNVIRELDYEEV